MSQHKPLIKEDADQESFDDEHLNYKTYPVEIPTANTFYPNSGHAS
jgi:hypothetical protein